MPDVKNITLPKIIKRLELIKSLIALEEEEEINTHVAKFEQLTAWNLEYSNIGINFLSINKLGI